MKKRMNKGKKEGKGVPRSHTGHQLQFFFHLFHKRFWFLWAGRPSCHQPTVSMHSCEHQIVYTGIFYLRILLMTQLTVSETIKPWLQTMMHTAMVDDQLSPANRVNALMWTSICLHGYFLFKNPLDDRVRPSNLGCWLQRSTSSRE